MSTGRRHRPPGGPHPQQTETDTYNIIPVHNLLADHPSLRYPEVRAAAAALRSVGNLRKPPYVQWTPSMDLLDWLALFFGFQYDNVKNQREHLVLHLSNAQMRLTPPPDNIDCLDATVLRRFRKKLLNNYTSWCSYLRKKSNIWLSDRTNRSGGGGEADLRRELLYVSLYLLIWGESANLRFMPECICFIYHNMAMELNKVLEDYIDENTGQPVMPWLSLAGDNAFLNSVVKPIYETVKREVESSKNGTAPHSAWRNYDDLNEYFWSKRCFVKLKWPLDLGSNFFVLSSKSQHVGKTGYVEQRSFWNLFRSFDRLWVMLILFMQAAIIVAWEQKTYPWQALEEREIQVKVLTVFFTWSGLRFVKALLDIGLQYSLVSRETMGSGIRMVLKAVVSAGWIVVFGVFYSRILSQKNHDGRWGSNEVYNRLINFLVVALVFLIPEVLAIALFIIPWIRNFIEESNWRIFDMITWWFQSRSFVGRGLREGLVDNIKYSLFWIFVLATKFIFSYFMQVKPLVVPTKELLKLKNVHYEWHQFFSDSNRLAVGLLWLPVMLVYFMDIQLWYTIYSSVAGALVGLFQHLGEIRNMQQLRLRFQFFASAIQFNLMPEEQLLNARGTFKNKFKDAIHRLKLRYGFGRPYTKLESNQVEASKFALIWNEIVVIFREEDIISDREVELLELPQNSWNVRVIRWPCFLLANELLLALSQAKEMIDAPDKWLWYKICKSEYRRCAVIEAYDSVKHLMLDIIKVNTEEHSILTVLFQEIDHSIQIEKFTKTFKTTALPQIHTELIKLAGLLNKPKKDKNQVVNTLQALYEIAVRDFIKDKRTTEQLKEDGLAPRNPSAMAGHLFENAVELPDLTNENFYRQVRRCHTILTSRDSMHNVPANIEARRRIAFFSNSLFMNMPHAPQVEKMMAFSVLTPYYNEEVLYSREQLRAENEDGISILYYLQTIYDDEWKNFMERMRREGLVKENEIWGDKIRDLRLWASYRGQTLSRTVRGMMYYYRALKMLAFLDAASEMDIREGARELGAMRRDGTGSERPNSTRRSLSRATSSLSLLFKGHEYGTALMKYTYVVACQIYGTQKANKAPQADDILYLMKNNEALRVAYVDEVPAGRDEMDLLAFIPTGWGMVLIAQVLRPFLQGTLIWEAVMSVARMYEILFGVIVMTPLAFLSWLPGVQSMQTRILFNDAFSRGLRIFQIITGKKSNDEKQSRRVFLLCSHTEACWRFDAGVNGLRFHITSLKLSLLFGGLEELAESIICGEETISVLV
ncbi:hypothetical protein ACFE04_019352 [Oxalis oulophora]